MKIANESNRRDSPRSMIITPIIIGFLTYLYGPLITNFLVWICEIGIKVPKPFLWNIKIHLKNKKNPQMRTITLNTISIGFKLNKEEISVENINKKTGITISTTKGSNNEMIICFLPTN